MLSDVVVAPSGRGADSNTVAIKDMYEGFGKADRNGVAGLDAADAAPREEEGLARAQAGVDDGFRA